MDKGLRNVLLMIIVAAVVGLYYALGSNDPSFWKGFGFYSGVGLLVLAVIFLVKKKLVR